ncbi:glycosyltransferase family 4 protein [Lactiplantibacillus pentosus]|uniref:Glycosyltransferase family 4 protein n=1 Tax=Lactiplantibacillus pentosus TaxID=1589 RepID=A0AAW8VZI7_LACPE|nr:glycosyltransferase family 4 protein [Lactiplantibacillus pentosus]MBO9166191.1 glycosyltransferase family 4 protein [Lactiplantibacillus pentosus]MBU7474989.1 glycosyltransferase family 4 protein [Lactiplantibacillus pentosus]MBU7530286.1 glycosyltransferase family 4 protein [Lactiplantibacillus pentosus]MCE6030994.1 glycosyltransferase family 4 protein [Lactiplantibacillus pentosus]MCT3277072.1 glycosyltransferase [Lactiplantibacillus pentosus]
MRKINFILPATNDKPIGGYKIVYQYANELSKRGYMVTINFLFRVIPKTNAFYLERLKRLKWRLRGPEFPAQQVTWFKLNKNIRINWNVVTFSDVPDADIVIGTAAVTAEYVKKLPDRAGRKFYFIQNYETWWFDDVESLEATYRLGLTNIVISKDLAQKVEQASHVSPMYLPNFYDDQEFFLERPIRSRRNVVALLNHIQESKRTKFGLKVLESVQREVPDLEVELFGAYQPVASLPDYVHFTYQATPKQLRNKIYGRSKVYLMPSVLEGWGLTGTEAMASGAALVASHVGGIIEYANETNSVLVDPNDFNKFVNEIVNLLKNDQRQQEVATAGYTSVQNYTLEKSTNRLISILFE